MTITGNEINVLRTMRFSDTDEGLGLTVRKGTIGPEKFLVDTFISIVEQSWTSPRSGLAIFSEPNLPTGFPDIVIARYSHHAYLEWNDARNTLTSRHLKLLHYLHITGKADSATITRQLGISVEEALASLDLLEASRLVRKQGNSWRRVGLRRIFGIKQLIAVEAKMADWSSAFEQATLNCLFASDSYILSPISRPSDRTLARSESLGVGIFTCNNSGVIEHMPSRHQELPRSHASWWFNEWIGRRLNELRR